MDDPPPLPGAIDILLASITSTSLTITSFIRAVRSARADLGAITRELADLYVVLDLLRDDHAVPTQMQARVRAVLRGCGVILARITALVADSSGSGSGSHDGATRVRWSTRDRNDMTLLSIGLQTHREALVLVDDVAHLCVIPVFSPLSPSLEPETWFCPSAGIYRQNKPSRVTHSVACVLMSWLPENIPKTRNCPMAPLPMERDLGRRPRGSWPRFPSCETRSRRLREQRATQERC